MKYLSDYTKEETSMIFEKHKAFYAFTNDQLDEAIAQHKIEDKSSLRSFGAGLIMPEEEAASFFEELKHATKAGIARDLAENGREAILERELGNYEIGYSWDRWNDPNFRSSIDGYGFTEDEIKAAYYKHVENTEY